MKRTTPRPARHAATARGNPRAVAAKVLEQVVVHSRYLDTALAQSLATLPDKQKSDAALIQEMAYGVLRWFHQLDALPRSSSINPSRKKIGISICCFWSDCINCGICAWPGTRR